jgi:hypothetical protein
MNRGEQSSSGFFERLMYYVLGLAIGFVVLGVVLQARRNARPPAAAAPEPATVVEDH